MTRSMLVKPRAILLGLTVALTLSFGLPSLASSPAGSNAVYTSSDWIERAQTILSKEGYLEANSYQRGEVDDETMHAVKTFQRDHTLAPTGWIDQETLAQLLSHEGPADSDGDNVADNRDQCPNTPRGTQVDERGCARDADNDTVADALDRCPDTPVGAQVDAQGCPKDSDLDAVYDGMDRCPDTMRGAEVDSEGCPSDSDRDSIADNLDRCPGTPEGTTVDDDGCPEESQPVATYGDEDSMSLEGVQFEPNTARLTPESKRTLDAAAEIVSARPGMTFEISGFTDDRSTPAHNLSLSRRRAEAVRVYLLRAGVDPARLIATGYGESRPVADNTTADGRAQNRRVEIAQAH